MKVVTLPVVIDFMQVYTPCQHLRYKLDCTTLLMFFLRTRTSNSHKILSNLM